MEGAEYSYFEEESRYRLNFMSFIPFFTKKGKKTPEPEIIEVEEVVFEKPKELTCLCKEVLKDLEKKDKWTEPYYSSRWHQGSDNKFYRTITFEEKTRKYDLMIHYNFGDERDDSQYFRANIDYDLIQFDYRESKIIIEKVLSLLEEKRLAEEAVEKASRMARINSLFPKCS